MGKVSLDRMKELIKMLNKAAKAYYNTGEEVMSNMEYDRLYDELAVLEKETGIVMADSPTINVGYEILSELPKEVHEKPMLSLNKTKSVDELAEFAGDNRSLLSWKLDGLTIVLTYNNGSLVKAVTRGNGEVGEVITQNAKVFKNIPLSISFKGQLIIRGEALIKYSDFKKINEKIEDVDAQYKNPRNLCSGSVRQLNSEIAASRNIYFYAFSVVTVEGADFDNSREKQFVWLKNMGFDVVHYVVVNKNNIHQEVQNFASKIEDNDLPSDGLVLIYDNISYGESLGHTAKFPRDSIAYKWADETAETKLVDIEWSASRTGLINPVAIFEPVELEGTTVTRASVHNVSIVEELKLGIGDRILVYKANMIIPQIAENLTGSGKIVVPKKCPVCGENTKIRQTNDIKYLICPNDECQAKKIKSFVLLASRNALNIEGLREATLEKFIQEGYIKEFSDIYHLDRYASNIISMEGFGEKSYNNLMSNIEKSRKTTLDRFIYSLGIPNIGASNAKMLTSAFDNDLNKLLKAGKEDLAQIDGVGDIIAESFISYFLNDNRKKEARHLLDELEITDEGNNEEQIFQNMSFVITGTVNNFANRNAVKEYIERRGGKVTSSVSKNTNYLINNDSESSSSKNKKAKELGIPIISEEEFMAL